MTGTGQIDHQIIEVVPTKRLVRPGSWRPCSQCRQPIEFVPGAGRTLVACSTYADAAVQSVQLFHTECYNEQAHAV